MTSLNWPRRPLGKCAAFLSGGTPSKARSEFWEGEIPWVSSGEMTERRLHDTPLHISEQGAIEGSRLVPANTVLAVVRGMSLAKEFRVSITRREVAFNQDLKALVCAPDVDPEFLFYALVAGREHIRELATEASHGTKKLDTDVLAAFPVAVPKPDVQRRVVDVLLPYDDLIENNRRRMALLEDAAQQLHREWFVRLRFPGHEHNRIKNGVPEGWTRRSLAELADFRLGKMLDQNKNKGDLMPYLANVNVRWGEVSVDDLREMRFEDNERDAYGLKYGDIVMCEGGEPGRCALWKDQLPEMMIQKAIHRIRAHPGVSNVFLYYGLRHKAQSGQMAMLFTGATIKHLPREKLALTTLDVPPARLMALFADQVDPVEKQIALLQQANRRASKARDMLLPRLMSGRIAV